MPQIVLAKEVFLTASRINVIVTVAVTHRRGRRKPHTPPGTSMDAIFKIFDNLYQDEISVDGQSAIVTAVGLDSYVLQVKVDMKCLETQVQLLKNRVKRH